ncbi:phage antirepressor KilAC domain-containing protein [Oceanimonas smirnovii]|uniref:phage antirepressor KilAC domain-containing protein n=1 Tax=Oceanimonas smirnovii TaxID=264574 RepID=UPI003FD57736
MNELMNRSAGELTMSSMEIAELTGKRHGDVIRDIRTMLEQLGDDADLRHVVEVRDARGYTAEFKMDRYHTEILVTGYDVKRRAAVIKRWFDLETGASTPMAQALPNFANPVEAARAWADAKEAEQKALQQAEQARPAVEFVSRYVDATGLQNLSNVAKMLSYGPIKFSRLLAEDGILYRSGGALVPKQEFIDRGLFRIKTGEANGHSWMQTKVTSKGVDWLAQRYATEVVGA